MLVLTKEGSGAWLPMRSPLASAFSCSEECSRRSLCLPWSFICMQSEYGCRTVSSLGRGRMHTHDARYRRRRRAWSVLGRGHRNARVPVFESILRKYNWHSRSISSEIACVPASLDSSSHSQVHPHHLSRFLGCHILLIPPTSPFRTMILISLVGNAFTFAGNRRFPEYKEMQAKIAEPQINPERKRFIFWSNKQQTLNGQRVSTRQ